MRQLRVLLVMMSGVAAAQPVAAPEAGCPAAQRALQTRDLNAARAASQACLGKRPNDSSVKAIAAEVESETGLELASERRFAEAAEHFRAVRELRPDFAGGHYNLGLALLNLGDSAGAEKSFKEAIRLAPRHVKAHTALANALLMRARRDQTRAVEAANALRQAIALSPNDAELHFNLGYVLGALADDNGALAEYRRVARIDPRYPDLHAALGYTLYRLSEYAAAEPYLQTALARNARDYSLQYHFGSTLAHLDRAAEAKTHFEEAARIDPSKPGPHFQLAALCRNANDQQCAAKELKIFTNLTAAEEAKWQNEALERAASTALRGGDLEQGIEALARAFEKRPDPVTARDLALAYVLSGDFPNARRWLDKAVALAPNSAATYKYVGLLEARQGNVREARKSFETAARLDPADFEATYNAGVTALESGDARAAITYLKSALKRSDDSRVHEALAVALTAAGRHAEAQQQLDAAQRHR